MTPRKIIVVGASAGGFVAFRRLFSMPPPGLPATIFAVIHASPPNPSYLPQLLRKHSELPIQAGAEGPFEEGVTHVARPDYHLVVERRAIKNRS